MSDFNYNTADANPILEPGVYDAVILNAKTGTTKSGDPKMQIDVRIYGPHGVGVLANDHIVAPWGIRRLRQLCEATGVDFSAGSVNPEDFVGSNVRVKVRIQEDQTGEYEDRNSIVSYQPDQEQAPPPDPAARGGGSGTVATHPASGPRASTVDEASAYATFVDAVRSERPNAGDDRLKSEFGRICHELAPDKKLSEFSAEDWARVATEGPKVFIPF